MGESDLVNQLGEPECNTEDPDTTCFFTHWDMLHESPLCMGIAHDPEDRTPFGNVYWAFDGLNSTLIRYDFSEPHGPGSLDHSIAAIRRYPEIELTRVPGIPGHLMMDPTERVLYIADTGGGRILRMNPDSGHFIRNAKREFPIYSSIAETFEYSIYGCAEWEVFVDGLDEPSGLEISEGLVYVSEHGTGKVLAFDRVTRQQIDSVQTDADSLLGIALDGHGNLWYSDAARSEVSKLVVEETCEEGSIPDHGVDIVVGGPAGWRVQDYTEVTAVVGQNLAFEFEAFYDVYLMPDQAAFDACDFISATRLANSVDSPYTYLVDSAGTFFFSDSVGMHCQGGQAGRDRGGGADGVAGARVHDGRRQQHHHRPHRRHRRLHEPLRLPRHRRLCRRRGAPLRRQQRDAERCDGGHANGRCGWQLPHEQRRAADGGLPVPRVPSRALLERRRVLAHPVGLHVRLQRDRVRRRHLRLTSTRE